MVAKKFASARQNRNNREEIGFDIGVGHLFCRLRLHDAIGPEGSVVLKPVSIETISEGARTGAIDI